MESIYQDGWRAAVNTLLILQVLFGRFNVSAKIPILLSLFSIGHLVELGLFPEFQVIFKVLPADFAGTHGLKHATARLGCMAAVPVTATGR